MDGHWLDIAESIGMGALEGCVAGAITSVSGGTLGLAATAGAFFGFAKGVFGAPRMRPAP